MPTTTVTKISDVIAPDLFAPYAIQRSTELSRLFQSGIIATDPDLDARAQGVGGNKVNLPFWSDLTGESEGLTDDDALTPAKIGTAQDIAVKHFRGKAWGANDLAGALAGDDPMDAIGNLVAQFWNRDMQQVIVIPSLTGIFAGPLANSHVKDISSENIDGVAADSKKDHLIEKEFLIDAAGLLGDHWSFITAIAMHSTPFQRLQKLNLIDFEPVSEQGIEIPRFQGREVIVDDTLPADNAQYTGKKYTTYLFANGSLAWGNGGPEPEQAVETDRDSLAGVDFLINRRHFFLHPRGVAFTGTPGSVTPTKAELQNGSNWAKRYDNKNIRIVKLVTNG